ncbi:hypothetical protein BDK51DRAFT_35329 [Blyttiomyces helicus]|uniref:Mitochondrial import inner membrane translocase subunit TIM50 n=1 Tax=Blyttiomyces helicus TaxID=388810 RepID=A0A4P9WFW9_9FUNG|nr:hypothetical protein BDK51DRAFT_35329 [Blyttiomyces helicus]|eukprot:RKO91679.1 hypothetical protein BDK51DRAFT_35329 [Blyttiomyces helicus]
MDRKAKILLVLDLNGTLLTRVKQKSEKLALRANPSAPKQRDFGLPAGGGKIFLRPYLDTFLDRILACPDFAVGVWTSAKLKNALVMINGAFGCNADRLAFKWHREQCSDIGSRKSDWSSKKDLRKLWDDPDINGKRMWSETTYNSENHLLVPEFVVTDPEFDCLNDTSLLSVVKYLDALRGTDDVRRVLRERVLFTHNGNGTRTRLANPDFAIGENDPILQMFPKNRPLAQSIMEVAADVAVGCGIFERDMSRQL